MIRIPPEPTKTIARSCPMVFEEVASTERSLGLGRLLKEVHMASLEVYWLLVALPCWYQVFIRFFGPCFANPKSQLMATFRYSLPCYLFSFRESFLGLRQ